MLVQTTLEFCSYLRTCDPEELAQLVVPELHELIINWCELSYDRRGELLGYTLGKYGLDILLPVAAIKGAKYTKALYDMKRADKLCTLQTLAQSPESKQALTHAATRWSEQRKEWFGNVKLDAGNQNKHIRGKHNFIESRSEWIHPDPELKIKQLAGKGQRVVGEAGKPGFKERVDCGEIIGYCVNKTKGERKPTTMAIIHYNQEGAHIVPANPKK